MPDPQLLRELAAARGGFVLWDDALAAGYSSHSVRQAVEAGRWLRPQRGVLVDRDWYETLDAPARHLVQLRARLHVVDGGWCAARGTAAVVHDLPLLGDLPAAPLLVRDRPRARTRGSSTDERFNTLPESDVEEVDGVRVTTLARTVLDLAREQPFAAALAAADAALRKGARLEEMLALARRYATWPGAPLVSKVLASADPCPESALESLSRAGFVQAGLPPAELQVEVWHHGRFVARTDFLWREVNVVGEADGRAKYEKVEDLYLEKRREETLRDLGLEVVRWDWASAEHPERGLHDALRRAFARGALNTLAPGVELRAGYGARAA